MYEYIKGILTKITAKYIVVETAGIGYLLHVANPYAYSGKMNHEEMCIRDRICIVFKTKEPSLCLVLICCG